MKLNNITAKKGFSIGIFFLLWLLFIGYVLFQHKMVFIHHDDLGYGALSYKYTGNSNGMNWGFKDLLGFLWWHYFNWGGRVLFFGFEALSLRNGEWIIQLVQSIVIVGIMVELYHLIRRKNKDILALIIVFSLWLSIGYMATVDGVYWYTASVLYVWPFLFFFGAILIERMDGAKYRVVLAILLFIAAFSQEQVAMLVCAYAGCKILQGIIIKQNFVCYIPCILSGMLCVFAPGNFVRSVENKDFFELPILYRIRVEIPQIIGVNLNYSNAARCIIYAIILLMFCVYYRKMIVWIVNITAIIALFIIYNEFHGILLVLCGMIFFIAFSAETIFMCINKKKWTILFLYLAAISTQAMMIISPVIAFRTSLPLAIGIIPVLGTIVLDMKEVSTKMFVSTLCLMAIAALVNSYIVSMGFVSNYAINVENHKILEGYSSNTDSGEGVIELKKLNENFSTPVMPYMKDCGYITEWIYKYYEIPSDVQIEWK